MHDLLETRARCDRLYRKAVRTSTAFLTVLEEYHDARDEEVENAGFLVGASANGHSTSLSDAGRAINNALYVARYLLDLYGDCNTSLVNDGVASPTDAEVYAEMMFRLVPTSSATTDFGLVRDEVETRQVLTS